MNYQELERTTTVNTRVKYTFDDGEVEVVIPHFFGDNKVDEDYIKLGIENRAVSEEKKLKEELKSNGN